VKVWVNGSFVDDGSAIISVFDAGFQHSVGLFETMHARNGVVFRGTQHMERLAESAKCLRLTERLQIEPLVEALQMCLTENGLEQARLRLTLTGGNLNLLNKADGSADPTIVIQSQPPTEYPDVLFEKGVHVSLASGRVNPYELLVSIIESPTFCGAKVWRVTLAHTIRTPCWWMCIQCVYHSQRYACYSLR